MIEIDKKSTKLSEEELRELSKKLTDFILHRGPNPCLSHETLVQVRLYQARQMEAKIRGAKSS